MGQPSGMHWQTCDVCGEQYRRTNWMKLHPWQFVKVDGKEVCIEDTHIRACVRKAEEAGKAVDRKAPLPPAFQFVQKQDEQGLTYVDMVPLNCEPPSHIYSPVAKQGPRKGRPAFGARCLCKAEQWTPEMEESLVVRA